MEDNPAVAGDDELADNGWREVGRGKREPLLLLALFPGLVHDERPVGMVGAQGFHEGLGFGDEVGLFRSEVFRLGEVGGEVVEINGLGGAVADGFPVAKTNGLQGGAFVEFPVKGFALGCWAAFEQFDDGVAVVRGFEFDSGKLGCRGQEVPEGPGCLIGESGGDFSWPAGDAGLTQPAFIKLALVATQLAAHGLVEKLTDL